MMTPEERDRKFIETMFIAITEAMSKKDVEVKVFFDDLEESKRGVEAIVTFLEKERMYDAIKTRERLRLGKEQPGVELTNGSCISFQFENKVWFEDHWIHLKSHDDVKKAKKRAEEAADQTQKISEALKLP